MQRPRHPAARRSLNTTFTNQLGAYRDHRGHKYVDQVTVTDMDPYASTNDGFRGKAKKLERLKGFVKFCRKRKWLTEDLAEDLEAPAGSSVTVPKAPFTDEELTRIHKACDEIGPPTNKAPVIDHGVAKTRRTQTSVFNTL